MRTHTFGCDKCGGPVYIETEDEMYLPPPIHDIKGTRGCFCERCQLEIEREWFKDIVLEALEQLTITGQIGIRVRKKGEEPKRARPPHFLHK